jgi:hypothetical protein
VGWLKDLFKSAYVTHLESENEWLRQQFEFQKGKIERLELALFPLSTTAGARYQHLTEQKPGEPKTPGEWVKIPGRGKTFAQIRQEYYAQQEREMAAEDAEAAKAELVTLAAQG